MTPPSRSCWSSTARRRVQIALLFQASILWVWGCTSVGGNRLDVPDRNLVIREQLVIHSDFDLPQHHRLLEELTAQRGDLAAKLEVPVSDEPVHVYLFDTADEFTAFMRVRFPELPRRRAFFVESDTQLAVFAHWGDRVAEDLRHEVAHGYLHSVVPNLPLWLDEGLAEYFEVARGRRGLNRPHVTGLSQQLATGWQPDLERLEQLSEIGEMTQSDYAESWAWVHFLLETTPQRSALLRGFLQALRRDAAAMPLSIALGQEPVPADQSLVAHLHELAAAP